MLQHIPNLVGEFANASTGHHSFTGKAGDCRLQSLYPGYVFR